MANSVKPFRARESGGAVYDFGGIDTQGKVTAGICRLCNRALDTTRKVAACGHRLCKTCYPDYLPKTLRQQVNILCFSRDCLSIFTAIKIVESDKEKRYVSYDP